MKMKLTMKLLGSALLPDPRNKTKLIQPYNSDNAVRLPIDWLPGSVTEIRNFEQQAVFHVQALLFPNSEHEEAEKEAIPLCKILRERAPFSSTASLAAIGLSYIL